MESNETNSQSVDKTNKAMAMLAIMRLIEKKRKGKRSPSKVAR